MTQISEAVECLEELGYTVTAPVEPKVELPTEPGWYLDKSDEAVYLAADGYWTTPQRYGVTGESMANHAPFTKLEPVPVIAKKVAEFVNEWLDRTRFYSEEGLLDAVDVEFAVHS